MAATTPVRSLRRPVLIASYGLSSSEDGGERSAATAVVTPIIDEGRKGLRYNFPRTRGQVHGGYSDGYCFEIAFAAGRLSATYSMIVQFLREEGYGKLPIPASVEELKAFRLPPKLRHQLSLFGEDGYVHNPVKILFPPPGGKRGRLILRLYDEEKEGHLLKFHLRS